MTAMSVSTVLRYGVLTVSAAAMVVGVLVVLGYLVPRYFPEQYRVVIGAVVFLYGAYRLAITFFRHKPLNRDEE
jgi:putative Ca2+/H+ antiporter (TMEM165/GDT1 family)